MNIDPSAVQVARRHFLNECGIGLGKAALGSLLVGGMPRSNAADSVQSNPLAAKQPHFPGKAKAVIHSNLQSMGNRGLRLQMCSSICPKSRTTFASFGPLRRTSSIMRLLKCFSTRAFRNQADLALAAGFSMA
jgi:hypothetical protein